MDRLMDKNKFSTHLLIISAVVAVVYINSLFNGFALDDTGYVINNESVHGFSVENMSAIFTSIPNTQTYLPVTDLTYMLDFELWGLEPFGYHLSNLLYYMVCCLLLYAYLQRQLARWGAGRDGIALAATLVFAVHPVHVESVAGIAQRKDLVSGIAFFASLLLYLIYKERKQPVHYAASLLLFATAMLSKGTTLVLPPILVLIELLEPGKEAGRTRGIVMRTMTFFYIGAAISTVHYAMGITVQNVYINQYGPGMGYGLRVLSAFKAAVEYTGLLIVPYPLTVVHDFEMAHRAFEPSLLLSIAAVVAAVCAAFAWREKWPVFSFSTGFFLLCLGPVVGLVPTSTIIAERYLFLPSAGACILAAYLARGDWRLPAKPSAGRAGTALLAAVIICFSGITIKRNSDWKDYLTLYLSGLKHNPDSVRLNWFTGWEYFIQKRYPEAFEKFDRARELDPSFTTQIQVFSALRAMAEGRPQEILSILENIKIPERMEFREVNYLYGAALMMKGENENARRYLESAIRSRKSFGIVPQGDIKAALDSLERASPKSP
jgi:tetratricopeptide (TPR) repeat protein